MRGGDLHWIWSPYSLYQDIDYVRHALRPRVVSLSHAPSQVYGLRAFENQEGFTNAQCKSCISLYTIAYLTKPVRSIHEYRREYPEYCLRVSCTRSRITHRSSYWLH